MPDAHELVATVGGHDARGGWVVLDDGTRLAYDAAAVSAQVRLLRSGQRVRLRVEGNPLQIRAVTLVSLPLLA